MVRELMKLKHCLSQESESSVFEKGMEVKLNSLKFWGVHYQILSGGAECECLCHLFPLPRQSCHWRSVGLLMVVIIAKRLDHRSTICSSQALVLPSLAIRIEVDGLRA